VSIQVEQLNKLYGKQKALDNINFSLKKGEVVGFLGPNGAGKSTTMKILSCFIPQSSGTAKVCGFDVVAEPMEVRRRLGYLPESNPLYTDMFVKEYLGFVAALHGMKIGITKRVAEIIDITGLGKEQGKKIKMLSKGYKQRVGLAQALIHNPEVLILDEPTSGLDPNQLVEIRKLIAEIGKDKCVMLSTHIMQEVEALCNRVIIINNGKIIADDSTAILKEQFADKTEISISFKKPIDLALLKSIDGIEQITKFDDASYLVVCRQAEKVKEALFNLASSQQTIILSLAESSKNLEQVFMDLTKQKS
jgi:ABC-2 type transport system ATP-binding protein